VTRYSPYASPTATIERLEEWGIHTRKSLGQHLLIDDGVVGRILRLADIKHDDAVLEIGPGIGTLTEALLRAGAQVLAIEKDSRMLPLLADIERRYPGRLSVVCADALSCLAALPSRPAKLVANLPYAVAATVVLDCFCVVDSLQSATVMVQREVAERMAAAVGTKTYGAYTVKLGLLARMGARFDVSPTSFLPPPRVTSTVIRIERRAAAELPDASVRAAFFTVVDAAFASRRKTIRNSMRSYLAQRGDDPARADTLLEIADIPPGVRGETLDVEEYRALALAFLGAQDAQDAQDA
jgi:16S rRNA (adenine1518-N6/adenine1519-N6)-dimethyltransferase